MLQHALGFSELGLDHFWISNVGENAHKCWMQALISHILKDAIEKGRVDGSIGERYDAIQSNLHSIHHDRAMFHHASAMFHAREHSRPSGKQADRRNAIHILRA